MAKKWNPLQGTRTRKQSQLRERTRAARERLDRSQTPVERTDISPHSETFTPDTAVPWGIRHAAAWSWRFLAICAALAVLIYVLGVFRTLVISILVAMLLTVLMAPFNRLYRKMKMPKALAALLSVVTFLGILTVLVGGAGTQLASGFSDLADKAKAGFDDLIEWLSESPLGLDEQKINEMVDKATASVQDNASSIAGGVMNVTGSVISLLTGLILAIFCMFFFLKDGRRLWLGVLRFFPKHSRHDVNEAAIRAWVTLSRYTRTQIQVAFIDAVGIALIAFILKVPLWFPIGVLVFVGSFVPIVGAFVTGAIATLVAFVDQGPTTALLMLAGVLLVQQIEGNVLQPFLQGTQLSLHPVVVVLAVAGGAGLMGIWGALFAVPLVAAVNVAGNYFAGRDMYPELSHDPNRPGGPPGVAEEDIEAQYGEYDQRAIDASLKDPAAASAIAERAAPIARPESSDRIVTEPIEDK